MTPPEPHTVDRCVADPESAVALWLDYMERQPAQTHVLSAIDRDDLRRGTWSHLPDDNVTKVGT